MKINGKNIIEFNLRKKANAALWSVWVAMIGVIAKLIFWN